MTMSALIDPHSLFDLMGESNLRLVDASFPADPGFHARLRIGDAVLFDVDTVSDPSNPLPHMLPGAATFAEAVGAMGIGHDDDVVIYDRSGIAMAAARAWWMFRCFGHDKVRVLNGGLPLWHALGFPLNSDTPKTPVPVRYNARFNPALVIHHQDLLARLGDDKTVIADARDAARFQGVGHIPGGCNIPYAGLIDPATACLKTNDPRIAALAAQKDRHIVTSCGSGITACVLALALFEAGRDDVAVYDGSWSEWALPALRAPVETGPGRGILPQAE